MSKFGIIVKTATGVIATTATLLTALRENPRVASSYGINVRAYILVAFAVSGLFAGIAGSLIAHHDEVIVGSSFDFRLALLFILMTVVGGLRNRVGVVIGSAFFALLEEGALVSMFSLGGFFEGTLGLPTEFVALVVGPRIPRSGGASRMPSR